VRVDGFRAPGRVNLIGEHVDYAGGLVLPAAIERGVTLVGEATADGTVRLSSAGFPGAAVVDLGAPVVDDGGWARYAAAVVAELLEAGVPLAGYDGTFESDLPTGSGLSSSAAFEVCLGGGLARAAGADLNGLELARLAQRSEHRAVGVPCGIMDQAASALGVEGHALLLDCATFDHRAVPLPEGLAIVIVDSGLRRRLEDSAYADRRREVEQALAALPPGAARSAEPDRVVAAAASAGVDGTALRRLRHVATENARVEAAVEALERPDGPDLAALGRIFAEGHASLRDDFEATTPELDLLVELAGEEGAVAARMTGGGFGGAVVILASAGAAEALAGRVAERYAGRTGLEPTAMVTRAAAGAHPL
jgi:galactokinase